MVDMSSTQPPGARERASALARSGSVRARDPQGTAGCRPRRGSRRCGPARRQSPVLLAVVAAVTAVACAPSAAPAGKPAAAPLSGAADAPAQASPPPLFPLRVAYAAIGAGMTPAWVAQDHGLFRQHGLDVELLYLASTRTDQGVMTGDTPIGFGTNTVALRLNGADLIAIAAINSRMSYTIFAQPGIASPADLRGKTVLVTAAGASNTLATMITLRHFGLEPHRDVALQPTGGIPEQVAIMSQGLADGVLLSPPASLRAVDLGLVPIANMSDMDIPFFLSGIGTTESFARDNAERVRRTLRAYVSAVALMRRDPALAKAVMGKYTQNDDPVVLDATYDYFEKQWGRPDFRVQPAAIAAVLRVLDLPGADTAKPEDFIDNRFVDELHASGFIREAGAE